MENMTRKKIKVLRSDNGREYTIETSKNFAQRRASREWKTPYTPQQNGVV